MFYTNLLIFFLNSSLLGRVLLNVQSAFKAQNLYFIMYSFRIFLNIFSSSFLHFSFFLSFFLSSTFLSFFLSSTFLSFFLSFLHFSFFLSFLHFSFFLSFLHFS